MSYIVWLHKTYQSKRLKAEVKLWAEVAGKYASRKLHCKIKMPQEGCGCTFGFVSGIPQHVRHPQTFRSKGTSGTGRNCIVAKDECYVHFLCPMRINNA